MPKEAPVVQWESTVLRYGASLKFGIAPAFPCRQREHDFGIIRSTGRCSALLCSMCLIYSPRSPSRATIGEAKVPNERRRSAFSSGASTTASSSLEREWTQAGSSVSVSRK